MSTGPKQPFFQIRNLEKRFNNKKVLDRVTLDVFTGETLVILGGSGTGKSVLLRHLNGLLKPDAGEVIAAGIKLNELDEEELKPVRLKVSMVFQLGALFDSLTVFDNVAFPLRENSRMGAREIAERVRDVLAMVDLPGTEALYPVELSGGMRKRVALARAIALEPEAVLYDEPTTGLDPLVTHKINQLIRSLQERLGFTSVVVTHDIRSAFAVGDRFALLDKGVIRFQGDADEARRTDDPLMREFLETAGF